ncbi:MAG TPA: hypothetical protein VNV15_07240 [Opitutaceae bacterium]|nr:hypothetical protein [Opitutaceae bacterium]
MTPSACLLTPSACLFFVVQRDQGHGEDIASLDGLDRYVRSWIGNRETGKGFKFGQATLMNKEWIYRWRNTIGGAPAAGELAPSETQVFSFPIDRDMFLEAGFQITDDTPGGSKRWVEEAEAIREEIKATIVLEPKPAIGSPNRSARIRKPGDRSEQVVRAN